VVRVEEKLDVFEFGVVDVVFVVIMVL